VRQTLLAAAAAFAIGGITTGAVLSHAQTAPLAAMESPARAADGASSRPGPVGWGHRMDHHRHGLRAFALVYRQPDRQLAPADVQKIAEAFLLWNGNHAWKVTAVSAAADGGPIAFSLSTPEGSVVAKFTMDPHNGRLHRIG
jgi:hypothetical protein